LSKVCDIKTSQVVFPFPDGNDVGLYYEGLMKEKIY